ncbi:MAG TPA: hypothetical protein VFA83_05750 [Acidimicrobiales bacterium]|nr:hypothetical protein [Acidimicrobiales bacterium]
MTYQCEECGKSLATEGGLAIHMDGHRPAPAPLTLATIPEPVGPVTPFELPEITPDPASHKSSRDELLVMGLAVATALIFLVGLIAAVHPSLIRDKRMSTVAASKSHGVAIPDASSSHAASPVSAPPATTPATTTPPSAADDVKVKSLVLQLADYGPGWKVDATSGGSSSSDSSSGGNIDQDMQACMGGINTGNGGTADTDGPDVVNGGLSASTSASLFDSAKDATTDFGIINNPSLIPCLKTAITKEMEAEGVPAGAVSLTVARFPVAAARVNSGGIRFIVTASGPGGTASFNMDMVLLQYGRAESFSMFSSTAGRIPATLEQTLVNRLAAKLLNVEQVSA